MDPLMELAKTDGIRIIEDSAQAHLAEYRSSKPGWTKVGNFGDMATFSFYPGKNLGAYGDAGAILTNNDELALKARMYANHGRLSKYNHEIEGVNSRLDNIQAAVLNVKLPHLSDWTGKRRAVAGKYLSLLRNIPEIVLPTIPENTKPVWHLFVIRSERRDELLKFLKSEGIHCGVHYPIALPNQLAYQYLGHTKTDFPVASRYQDEIMSLPMFPEISDDQLEFAAENIRRFFNNS
jgi:dTDP-4-amino-4,6-dideoxygalactose transaminase